MKKNNNKYLTKAVKDAVEDVITGFFYSDFNIAGNREKMTLRQYVDAAVEYFYKVADKYDIRSRIDGSDILYGVNDYDD
jgi:hypothetical protein